MAINLTSSDLLTEEQLSSHFAVYAGPGSGKTHFLVNNIKNIVSTHPVITGSNERKVLCITYTNAAVDEIQRRLDRYASSVVVSTIHSFIIDNIIIPFQGDLKKVMKKDFGIDVTRRGKISSQIEGLSILHGYEKEVINEYLQKVIPCSGIDYSKKILSEVEIDNNAYLHGGLHIFSHSKKINSAHVFHIKKYVWEVVGKLTHDEILYFGYRMLQENSTITYALRVKYPFVFVDEFQDTNPLQTKIITLLGEKSTTVGVVGDVAQSIYSFQGAQPSQFSNFTVAGKKETGIYHISGNRRSTANIVSLCNYLRSADVLEQTSIKPYKNDEDKQKSEQIPVRFICGNSPESMEQISALVESGGVVLTRTWAAAFEYIQGINEVQRNVLNKIYNNYFPTSIDIRADIVEHNRVTWVRAFRFIMLLNSAHKSGSLIDVLNAIGLYSPISHIKGNSNFSAKVILKIRKLLDKTFEELTSNSLVVDIIEKFNATLLGVEYKDLQEILFDTNDFTLQYISDFDEKIADQIKKITWDTASKLFSEVFSKDAKYMTVHQAKGLEWDTVIVAAMPTKRDGASLINMFNLPEILGENSVDEFVRIYYVACSRARKSLYIHIPDDQKLKSTIKQQIDLYVQDKNCFLKYEFI